MKNLIFIGLLTLGACKKPDNGPSMKEENKPFVGTWIGRNEATNFVDTIVFKEDQSFSATSNDSWFSFSVVSIDTLSLSFRNTRVSRSQAYFYSLDKNTLIIKCWVPSTIGQCYNVTFKKQ